MQCSEALGEGRYNDAKSRGPDWGERLFARFGGHVSVTERKAHDRDRIHRLPYSKPGNLHREEPRFRREYLTYGVPDECPTNVGAME